MVIKCSKDSNTIDKLFKGSIKKLCLVSNSICFGPTPDPECIVEQHLTINNLGEVNASFYCYGTGDPYQKHSCIESTVSIDKLCILFKEIENYFSKEQIQDDCCDVGFWTLELTNMEDRKFLYQGALIPTQMNLSTILRATLYMPELFAFDGKFLEKQINRIKVTYNAKDVPSSMFDEYSSIEEVLVIDRMTQTIKYFQQKVFGYKVTKKYELKEEVSELLDYFEWEELFSGASIIEDNNGQNIPNYCITVEYANKEQDIISGLFDRQGLPIDYHYFINMICELLDDFEFGALVDESLYLAQRIPTKYVIYCSVLFDQNDITYYYQTNDPSIKIGDYVLVPVGSHVRQEIAKVVNVEHFNVLEVPFPIELVKFIIDRIQPDKYAC